MTGSNRTVWRALLVGALVLPLPPGPVRAQMQQPDTAAQVAGTLAGLRDRIEERYQVLPIQNGIVLIPKVGGGDVQSVELAGETIAVNGQAVTGAELRQRVGQDADMIIRLSFLDPETRRVLFGLGAPPAGPGVTDTTAVAAAPAAPAEPAEPEGLDIDRSKDRVRVGGSVHVKPGETVHGDVVAVGGSVRVDGRVTGDVVAVGGALDLGPESVVEGDAVSVGGRIHRAPGAVIEGEVIEVGFGMPGMRWRYAGQHAPIPWGGVSGVIAMVMWIVVLGLLTCLALLLARRPIERMEHRVRTSPWKAAAVGLAAEILFFPVLILVVVVLAISIIGIPLLLVVPFAILALVVGILLGFTAVAKTVGHAAESRFGWSHANPYVSLLVGLGLIMSLHFFAHVLGVGGGPLRIFALILGILGFILEYAAWTVGFGALLLTRFGTRYRWGEGEGAVAPTPSAAPYGEPGPAPATTSPAPPAGE